MLDKEAAMGEFRDMILLALFIMLFALFIMLLVLLLMLTMLLEPLLLVIIMELAVGEKDVTELPLPPRSPHGYC
jgi:hypothetical protein